MSAPERRWLERWAWRVVTRELARDRRDRLVYVDRLGRVVDLGPARREDLVGLAWAVRVAYRATRERPARARLASLRDGVGARLDEGAKKV